VFPDAEERLLSQVFGKLGTPAVEGERAEYRRLQLLAQGRGKFSLRFHHAEPDAGLVKSV
jgi:hypothetical protein